MAPSRLCKHSDKEQIAHAHWIYSLYLLFELPLPLLECSRGRKFNLPAETTKAKTTKSKTT